MTDDYQASNDNKKSAKRLVKKSTYADVGKTIKVSPDKTRTENGEVVNWINLLPK